MTISIGLAVVIILLSIAIVYRLMALRIIGAMLREYAKKKPLIKESEILLGIKNFHYSLGFAVMTISWQQLVIEYRLLNGSFLLGFGYSKIITILLLILIILFSANAYFHLKNAHHLLEHVEEHQKRGNGRKR